MVFTGLDIERKASYAEKLLFEALGGREQFDEVRTQLVRADRPDAPAAEQASAQLRVTVKAADATVVGRRFSGTVIEQALSGYAGFFTTSPPTPETAFGVYSPTLVPADAVEHTVVFPDGRREMIAHPVPAEESRAGNEPSAAPGSPAPAGPVPAGPEAASPGPAGPAGAAVRAPLGAVCGARSGDKGGNANVGLWAADDAGYEWLDGHLTVERVAELIPEAAGLEIQRYAFPNLRALNFVIVGLLGDGVAASTRFDPQAKGLGEFLRSRYADIPAALVRSAGRWDPDAT
jgi:hypothetical protein